MQALTAHIQIFHSLRAKLCKKSIHEKCASLQPVTVQMDSNMAQKKEEAPMDVAAMSALIEAQRKQIEKLEKQLKYSQDKNLALNTLIDVIEEQGIKVRKKAGVKQ